LAFAGIANAQNSNPWPSSGNVGIGTNAPSYLLDLSTGINLDGIRIKQTNANASVLMFEHGTSLGGHNYGIYSSGTNNPNPGSLEFYDLTAAATRLFIKNDGNIGIGTRNLYGKLTVLEQGLTGIAGDFESSTTVTGSGNVGIRATASNGDYYSFAGQFTADGSGENTGILADASGGSGSTNVGGKFISSGTSATKNIGVFISTSASGTPANDWGVWSNARGYFAGAIVGPSDQKLKNNIKPLTTVIDKIKLLKPSTYIYRTEEYKNMNFPQGEQIGLIAQDVEKVFPTVVVEVAEISSKNAKGEAELYAPQHKAVSYVGLVPVLIKGMQEQQLQIENQAKENGELKIQIAELQKQLNHYGLEVHRFGLAD